MLFKRQQASGNKRSSLEDRLFAKMDRKTAQQKGANGDLVQVLRVNRHLSVWPGLTEEVAPSRKHAMRRPVRLAYLE